MFPGKICRGEGRGERRVEGQTRVRSQAIACGEDMKKAQPQSCPGQRQGSSSIYTPVGQSLIVDCLCSSSPRVGKESIGSSVRTAFSQRLAVGNESIQKSMERKTVKDP